MPVLNYYTKFIRSTDFSAFLLFCEYEIINFGLVSKKRNNQVKTLRWQDDFYGTKLITSTGRLFSFSTVRLIFFGSGSDEEVIGLGKQRDIKKTYGGALPVFNYSTAMIRLSTRFSPCFYILLSFY